MWLYKQLSLNTCFECYLRGIKISLLIFKKLIELNIRGLKLNLSHLAQKKRIVPPNNYHLCYSIVDDICTYIYIYIYINLYYMCINQCVYYKLIRIKLL